VSVVFGLLALPLFYRTAVNPGLAILGLGLAVASAYVVYKNWQGKYGWALAGAGLNILALLLMGWGGTFFHGQPYSTKPAGIRNPVDKGLRPGEEKSVPKEKDWGGKVDNQKDGNEEK
jgi:hypothetical protein